MDGKIGSDAQRQAAFSEKAPPKWDFAAKRLPGNGKGSSTEIDQIVFKPSGSSALPESPTKSRLPERSSTLPTGKYDTVLGQDANRSHSIASDQKEQTLEQMVQANLDRGERILTRLYSEYENSESLRNQMPNPDDSKSKVKWMRSRRKSINEGIHEKVKKIDEFILEYKFWHDKYKKVIGEDLKWKMGKIYIQRGEMILSENKLE